MLTQSQEIITEGDFQRISGLVYEHCGINLHDGKRELVQARIAKKLRTGGYASAAEYMEHVLADASGEEFADLIDALSTNLTSFFRERSHFDYLSRTHLPALIERKRRLGEMRIRAWSAGCSSGEEPYTLAITLHEALERGGAWDVKILATDISRKVLRTAQSGIYDRNRLESVEPGLKGRYFTMVSGREAFQANQNLRACIRFNYLNLQEPWPFKGPFDFILCRNVMIYFDKPTQQKLVNRFHQCLDSGGLLFTGHSESLTGIEHPFRYVQPTIYAKA
jgi:chemotaxis protein methyltransferase CheR